MKESKSITIDPNTTQIGDIVADNYHAAGIFKEFGIDFCCGGGISLKKACEKRNLNPDDVLDKLKLLQSGNNEINQNYLAWEPGFLIDHIQKTHHNFVREKITEISSYAKKVAKVHGKHFPENVKIYDRFLLLSDELLAHLEAEEERVFPIILQLCNSRVEGKPVSKKLTDTLRKELKLMEEEHKEAGDVMKEIRELSNNFTPPPGACTTYRILYKNLAGFEEDLHKHVHLENNILFKKAGQLVSK